MQKKQGETNLEQLIANMEPVLNKGDYVFVSVAEADLATIPRAITIAEIREKEGITLILPRVNAEQLDLPFDFVASWITLMIHSALEAVGLTAAFSAALAQHQISCNVVAGYYHDHIFVAKRDREKAMEVLRELKM